MTMRRRVEQVVDVLEPCLKEGKGRNAMHYETTWGWKTKEGLRNSIQAIIEQDNDANEKTLQQVLACINAIAGYEIGYPEVSHTEYESALDYLAGIGTLVGLLNLPTWIEEKQAQES